MLTLSSTAIFDQVMSNTGCWYAEGVVSRSDQQFEMFLAEANSFAGKCGSEVVDGSFSDSDPTALQNKRRRTLPAHLADGENVIDMTTLRCHRPEGESEEQRFRREFYFSFLDKILNELNKRLRRKHAK